MANEAQIRSGLQIRNGNLTYQSQPQAFTATVSGANGPTPGAVLASTAGTNVSFSQLSALGGLCRIMNLDTTNYVEFGIYSGSTFCPLGELLPGESYVFRLSRNLLYGAVGTAAVNQLRLRAHAAACRVLVEAFDP